MGLMMKRGDIYWVDLNPTIGSEIKKKRPCVLIGATPINKARRIVVVIPLSSAGEPKPRPPLTIGVKCLGKKAVAVCDQIRAVDKSRLQDKIGELGKDELLELENGLRQVLCL
jgi:mRNA interferase MazF